MSTMVSSTAIAKRRAFHRYLLVFLAAVLYLGLAASAVQATPSIPTLNWPRVMSDWINVTAAPYNAVPGTDCTAAIQAALDQMQVNAQNGSAQQAIYFPAGTYYISSMLTTDDKGGGVGTAMFGTGSTTILQWTGAAGGTMLDHGGWPYAWHEGITWNGAGIAAIGIDNRIASSGYFPTGERHQNEAFLNFTTAGIRSQSSNSVFAFSEMYYRNCLFSNCAAGIYLQGANTFNHRIEQCEFDNCGNGIYQSGWANAYISECHFQGSTSYDVDEADATVGMSIRRCTSLDSYAFSTGSDVSIEDCIVDSWTNTACAVNCVTGEKDEMIVDTCFLNPPSGASPPIQADNYSRVMLSNVRLNNSPTGLASGQDLCLVCPPDSTGCDLTGSSESFLKSTWPMPSVVKDLVQDFGAVNNQDATTAFQNGVAAVQALGNGAWLYVPAGVYSSEQHHRAEWVELCGFRIVRMLYDTNCSRQRLFRRRI